MSGILPFCYLQLLDLLTTLAFLVHGVEEGNPVVRFALHLSSSPLTGLAAVKTFALCLGFYCWSSRRKRVLAVVNSLFAGVVAWNVMIIILCAR